MAKDSKFDETISRWLEDTAPNRLPERVLSATFERTRRSRQQLGWRALLGRFHMPRFLPALGSAAVVVVSAALALNFYVNRPSVSSLPDTPDSWSRVLIETPEGTGSVASLAAGPQGLLAVIQGGDRPEGGDGPTRLVVSNDGRSWTLVPEGQHPLLSGTNSFGLPSVVGTDRGFLLLQLNEVWTSENGYDWRRLASPTTGGPGAATVGGPGLVGVGGDRAWYSVDGSEWSLAEVPPLPEEILARPDQYVAMTGVTAAGNDLVAWGIAEVPLADDSDEHLVVPLLWASHDGRTWVSVVDPLMDSITAVTGGPGGFVAAGEADGSDAAWFSADGQGWEKVDVFESRSPLPVELNVGSVAASSAGYLAVGGDGGCLLGSCPSAAAAIWTSVDGRSWSRLPSNDLFRVIDPINPAETTGAWAKVTVAWGPQFVVGGEYDGRPAIWISDSEQSGSEAHASTAPAPAIPTPTPGQPLDLTGTWEATDRPPDSSHLTLEVIATSNGNYDLTIRDDFASVCGGVPSTMIGVAEETEPGTIVIEQPEYTCDDGSQPQALSGPPLGEQLRNLSLSYDSLRDALFDSLGLEWTRMAGQ